MQQLPRSNALEIQQNWETDSAFASGASSPAFNLSSQLDNQGLKQNFAEELQFKNQERKENTNSLIADLTEKSSRKQ